MSPGFTYVAVCGREGSFHGEKTAGEEEYTCTSGEHCYDKVDPNPFFATPNMNGGKINKNDMSSDGCVKNKK
jgi:hypothetical protein